MLYVYSIACRAFRARLLFIVMMTVMMFCAGLVFTAGGVAVVVVQVGQKLLAALI